MTLTRMTAKLQVMIYKSDKKDAAWIAGMPSNKTTLLANA
jgi:hypothetical protein